MQPPDGPPICTALYCLAAGDAAADVEDDLAQRRAHRDLDQAGARTLPERAKTLVPLLRRGAAPRNHVAPVATMTGTLASVSTLLMTVGLPNRPRDRRDTAGRGRGMPRRPSMLWMSAVSSPQT